MLTHSQLVTRIEDIEREDKKTVGSELADLGEVSYHNVLVLPQTIITPFAFDNFLQYNNLNTQIKHLLGTLNHERHDSLVQISSYIKKAILTSALSKDITIPLFKNLGKYASFDVKAYYFQNKFVFHITDYKNITGESVVAEKVKEVWAYLFTSENIKKHSIYHTNHNDFTSVIRITPVMNFELTGFVKTLGHTHGEYEIEAHSHVRFIYDKHSKRIKNAYKLPAGNKDALSVTDIKVLVDYAKSVDKAFYFPQTLFWGKINSKIYATDMMPASTIRHENEDFSYFARSITVHPGITIGKLRVINERDKTIDVTSDEIVLLKYIDKTMISMIKKAKGIIIEGEIAPEIKEVLKSAGIPAIVRKSGSFLYTTGDIISLNATTGEVRRGSMLVS